MQKFVVRIEWTDESITEEVVSEKAWFGLLYEALESNNEVENYQVYTITV